MTDRSASWRMPTRKQMEKLAAETSRKQALSAGAPEEPLPPEYWQSVLQDLAPSPAVCKPVRRRCLGFSATFFGSPAAGAGGSSRYKKLTPCASTDRRRSGKRSGSGCWTTSASNGPAVSKRMAAGLRSSSCRRARWMPDFRKPGWRRNIILRPFPEVTAGP